MILQIICSVPLSFAVLMITFALEFQNTSTVYGYIYDDLPDELKIHFLWNFAKRVI